MIASTMRPATTYFLSILACAIFTYRLRELLPHYKGTRPRDCSSFFLSPEERLFDMTFVRRFFCLFLIGSCSIAAAAGVVPSLVGSANVMSTGTYPRANFLSDGSLIGAATVTVGGNHVITIYKSTDQGTAWAQIGTADTGSNANYDIDNPYVLQLPSGRVLVAFRNHDRNGSNDYSYFRITVCYSDDKGVSWLYLSTAAQNAGPAGHGLWEPFMRNAQDGSLQLYYSHENSLSDQDNLMVTSHDGGVTWSSPITVSGGDLSAARDGMVGVAAVSGSNLIAVFESEQNGYFTINSVTSSNDGQTWGNRQRVYTPVGTNRNAGAPQVVNVGGTLAVSFMTDEDASGGTWVDNPDAKVVTSGDGGKTWGNKLTWSGISSFWPGLLDLDGSNFLGLVDDGGAKAQHIKLS
jgi:hypothetical protein